MAHTSTSLGQLYLEQGRLGEARPLLGEAAEAFRAADDDNGLAHSLASLGALEREAGNPAQALIHLEAAAERFETRWRAAFRRGDLARPTALVQDIDARYVELLMELEEIEPTDGAERR